LPASGENPVAGNRHSPCIQSGWQPIDLTTEPSGKAEDCPMLQKGFHSRHRPAASRHADVKPWVMAAIVEEDARSPDSLWKNAPTADTAEQERLRRIRFLRRHQESDGRASILVNRLDQCEQNNRCCSGACPECGRLFQRGFVRYSKSFVSEHVKGNGLAALSIIPAQPIVRPGKLNGFSIKDLHRRLKYALGKTDLSVGLGGVDFSFNEHREGKYKPYWSPHVYLIASTADRKKLGTNIRKQFTSRNGVPRPTHVASFENTALRRSYALKMKFDRRIGYTKKASGKRKSYEDTSYDKLRANELLELLIYLNQIGLAARAIYLGAKPISGKSGVQIVRT
jgi:hypothetical protein